MRYLTRDEVREIDRHAIEDLGLPGVVLMENAGRGVAAVVRDLLAGLPASAPEADQTNAGVAIVCGRGNNGGDGYVAARHLANDGTPVTVYLVCDPADVQGDARINLEVIRRMGLSVVRVAGPSDLMPAVAAGVIVDAIFGTGLRGAVREPYRGIIALLNELGRPIVAVDIPSGLDCDTGRPLGIAIRAARTVSFVAAKKGFADPASAAYTGAVTVCDIGVPAG